MSVIAPQAVDQPAFRSLFPAVAETAWFDTPGSPPGCTPVVQRMRETFDRWSSGDFDWLDWDAAADRVRLLFAAYAGVAAERVAVLGSVAEAASTVARSLPPGRIVVSDEEFRSTLWPFTSLDPERNPVTRVLAVDGVVRTEDLVAAIDGSTVLVSVSEVLSSNGNRADLFALRQASRAVGARLFVDLTQSLGVLDTDLDALDADFVAVHGYKWLSCPRGAAWLVVRPDRLDELRPLLPNWKSTRAPYGYFGGDAPVEAAVDRLDTSPAWFSWIGAEAAIPIFRDLDAPDVEAHVLALSDEFVERSIDLGCRPAAVEKQSQIVVVQLDSQDMADAVAQSGVRCSLGGLRLRVGFHYFNDGSDLDRLLGAMSGVLPRAI